jgi:hypothetical protein
MPLRHSIPLQLLIITLLGGLFPLLVPARAAEPPLTAWMPGAKDHTSLSWTAGSPRAFNHPEPPKEEILCFEFGGQRMLFDTKMVRPVEGDWECAATLPGQRYRCTGYALTKDDFFENVRFVECGRNFHRVIINQLKFEAADGQLLPGNALLEIAIWPDRLTFRLESDGDAELELRHGEKKVTGMKSVRLDFLNPPSPAIVESELPVTRDESLGCHRLKLPEKPWSNSQSTFYPEEHLDRIDRWKFTLRNDGDTPTVARLMFTQQHHLPITGFTPMLCDPDGTPTGLPVQVSKNWHQRRKKGHIQHEGPWFHGFAWVKVPPKAKRDFILQMVHARYGGVCAASHAQLSLIGWGHNQFWDQAAVGSFGESICFEPGRVQRRCFITDVRPLMTLSCEPNAKRWGWAENCGGGDFLMWQDPKGRYQPAKATRTDYRSHGPCLTDVIYSEETRSGEIAARMEVSLPANNDHLRTFLCLRYDVRQPVQWRRLAFFQLGADFYNTVPARRVAIGDATGLREEWEPQRAKDVYDRTAIPLTGQDPWISIHGVQRESLTKGNAAASRGLIIRSWRAVLGGKPAAPHLSSFCTEWGKGNHRTSVELAPPPGIDELKPGDFVETELEWVVFPADAAAYYGPDAALREMLTRDADTWRPVHREAVGNRLKPQALHGTVQKSYPLRVAVAEDQTVHVKVPSGLGHLPITITGLTSPRSHRLSANGKPLEHWQTDWNPTSQRWQISANVPPMPGGMIEIKLQP